MAAAILAMGKSVVAIEMHPDWGSFSTQLILTPARTIRRLLESAKVSAEEVQEALFKLPSGMQVLFGPQTVEEFSAEINAEKAFSNKHKTFLEVTVIVFQRPSVYNSRFDNIN